MEEERGKRNMDIKEEGGSNVDMEEEKKGKEFSDHLESLVAKGMPDREEVIRFYDEMAADVRLCTSTHTQHFSILNTVDLYISLPDQ